MTHEEAEQALLGVIEAQFDIHAMDPEDFAEMWVGISAVLRKFARAASVDTHAKQAPSPMGSAVAESETPKSPPQSHQ